MSDELEAFAMLVKKLRDSQRKFFQGRSHTDLFESKRLEKIVDERCREILEKQGKLI